jgi:hypothetical protein
VKLRAILEPTSGKTKALHSIVTHLILSAAPGSTQESKGEAEGCSGAHPGQAKARFLPALLRLIIWNPEKKNNILFFIR